MRSRLALAAASALAIGAAACQQDAFAPVTTTPPDSLVVRARSLHSVQIEWMPNPDPNVIGYRVQRRAEFGGDFVTVGDDVPQALPGPIFYLDTGLEAETFYGYRIVTVDRFSMTSSPSVVRGVRTPLRPSIFVTTLSQLEAPRAADPDGYSAIIRGPGGDTVVGTLVATGERRFGPLPPGGYQVELTGLAGNCAVTNGAITRTASITDVGLLTTATVDYLVGCVDPELGQIRAVVAVTGDDRDSTGYLLRLAGISPQEPESLRVTTDSARLATPDGGPKEFTGLRPGDYLVTLDDLDPKCSVDGTVRSVQVVPLSRDTVTFNVSCPDYVPPDTTTPPPPGYHLRNVWTAAAGNRITLTLSIDMAGGGFNDPNVNGSGPDDVFAIQGSTQYDATKLRFVSGANVTGSKLSNLAVNGSTPGTVQWGNFTVAPPATGTQGIAVITFDVIGTGTVSTRTAVDVAESEAANNLVPRIVRIESSISLGGGGGGGGNQAPTARANGPYAGSAGMPIAFSSAGSSDSDGSIASYSWSFGDGTTSTNANPSKAYAAAGSYTATLIVTDNQGATGSATAAVTVSAGGGGGNQAPTARANGPYAGSVGTPIAFSSAGSSDPDGSIAGYSWSFGDGTTSTAANPSKSYAAAGTYTAMLTVTDNLGATGSSSATVTVTSASGGSTPFTWSSAWGGNPTRDSLVTLTLTLDLTQDIPATPGAEELASYVVDSLKWDAAVLQYFSFNHGPGGAGSVNSTYTSLGKLIFQGTVGPNNRTGLITIAVLRFRVLAGAGRSTTTATGLGALTGTAATGSYGYRPQTRIQEATLTTQ